MRRALTVLLVLPVLAACSSSPEKPAGPDLPAESAFAEGTCRAAAPDLLELGRTIPRLGKDATVAPDVQESLATTQDRLALLAEGVEPQYAAALGQVVERIGGVRIRAVGNTYEPALGKDLQESFDEVLDLCTDQP